MSEELAHLIIDIVKGEEVIGGIRVAGLTNRIQADYRRRLVVPPSEDEIGSVVFDLITTESLLVRDSRLTVPRPKETLKPLPPGKYQGNNDSGMHPIGSGDYLYNQNGEPVAIVTKLEKRTMVVPTRDPSGGTDPFSGEFGAYRQRVIVLEVQALFNDFYASDGTRIPGDGEVLSGKNKTPKPAVSYDIKAPEPWSLATFDRPIKRVKR